MWGYTEGDEDIVDNIKISVCCKRKIFLIDIIKQRKSYPPREAVGIVTSVIIGVRTFKTSRGYDDDLGRSSDLYKQKILLFNNRKQSHPFL